MTKVITYGTFDLFHEGHYRLLQRAKALGDYLIVGVTTEHFDETRGKLNLVDDIVTRIDNIRKTGFADKIIVEDHFGQKIEDIQRYGVDIFVEGSDWRGKFDYLNEYCKVVYLDRTPNISSTQKRNTSRPIVQLGIIGTGRIAPRFYEESKYVSGVSIPLAYNPVSDAGGDTGKDDESAPENEKSHRISGMTAGIPAGGRAAENAAANHGPEDGAGASENGGKGGTRKPHGDRSARAFRDRTGVEVCTGDFEGFLGQVDAVYIASPNETHTDYARRALEAGKHVLCEKPVAFTYEESSALYRLAKEKGVVLLEGIRTAYLPGFQQLLNVARGGAIGEIRDVEACFSRLADPASREMTDAAYGGAFLEFGSYSLLPVIKLLGWDYDNLQIDSIYGETGIDAYTKIQFKYRNALATAKAGCGVKSEGQLIVAGTKGYILCQSPWWLTRSFDVRYEDPSKVDHYESDFKGDGFRYEISEFVKKINGTDGNTYKVTAEESMAMARIVEQFMKQRR